MTAQFSIPPSHPSLAGHFPGNPLVPGVVLLDEVLALLPATALESAKFTAPVRAGDAVELAFTPGAGGRVAFTGTVAGRAVLRGVAKAR